MKNAPQRQNTKLNSSFIFRKEPRLPVENPPAQPGMRLEDVDTPALLVDLDAYEWNIDQMAKEAANSGMRLRPHAKTHKCAVIALDQISHGAVGVCCQKVSEAEALVNAGVRDIFVTNEVVGLHKITRLASLAKRATMAVCVDNQNNLEELSKVVASLDVHLGVCVEVDVGGARCGVQDAESVLALAQRIQSLGNLEFKGLQAYQGRAQHVRTHAERKAAIHQSADTVRRTLDLLSGKGLSCEVVSGAGTGTYRFEAASSVYNEIQPGSYIFMDADYGRNLTETGTEFTDFRQSLFVYTQVMSMARKNYAVVDAGLKAIAFDSGMPVPLDLPGVQYGRPSDEHGVLDLTEAQVTLSLGSKIKLIPGHCDPTVNLYDWYVAVRGDRVEALWPIVARGAVS
jgi:3-hydroxy-D-aspartate aldolase